MGAAQKIEVEHWVIEVMRKNGRDVRFSDMSAPAKAATLLAADQGVLVILPDGRIGKPVEGYTKQEDAHARRELLRRQRPGVDFRVVIATNAPT